MKILEFLYFISKAWKGLEKSPRASKS